MKSVCEFTYKDLKTAIDPNFLRARDRIRQLRTRGTRYAGLRGMSLYFRTPSSEYDKNHIIWTQEIKLLDLPEALLMDDLTLREKVNLSMNGDVAVRCNCLVGDTPIPLLDGRTLTMEQLEKEFGTEKRFWVYSVNEKGDFVPAKARCLGKTGDVRKLVRVTLDNNESFTCTPDHPVMRRDGSWVLAGNLVGGESLMPIYRRTGTGGYEDYLVNSTQKWKRTYQQVATTVNRSQLKETWKRIKGDGSDNNVACHHVNEVKSDNTPENLHWMGHQEHWSHHSKLLAPRRDRYLKQLKVDPKLHAAMVESNRRAGKKCLELHPEMIDNARVGAMKWLDEHKEVLSERMKNVWKENRDVMIAGTRKAAADPEVRKIRSDAQKKSWADSVKRASRIADMKKSRSTKEYRERQKEAQRKAWSDPDLLRRFRERMEPIWKSRAETRAAKKQMVMNHKVASVVHLELDDSVPVYDLEVDVTHNFLIGPGIIVHNCPAMLYWGYAYLVSQLDAGAPGKLYSVPPNDVEMPENRFPGIRNPDLRGSVCKHLGLVFEVFGAHWNSLERDLKSQGYE